MSRRDLKYLWAAKGRGGKLYHFYRRGKQRVPIADETGQRLTPEHYGFLAAYERIHASFEDVGPAGPAHGTLAAAIELYKGSPKFAALSPVAKLTYVRHMDLLREAQGRLQIKTISAEFAESLRDKLADRPSVANRRVAILIMLLNFAERRRRALGLPMQWRNPIVGVEKLPEGPGYFQWPDNVIDAVAAGARKEARWLVLLALYTGQRPGDVIKMLWSDVRSDGEGEYIQVTQQKTGTKVWIPVHPRLRALLDEIPMAAAVILTTSTGRCWTQSNYTLAVREAMKAAGFHGYSLHGLRKNATTRLLEAGCSTDEVKAITGHETTAMVEHYGKGVNRKRLARSAVVKLEQWKNEK